MADDIDPAVVIARDMRKLPPETQKAVRPALRQGGEIIAADARTRADWSSRIPGSIRVRTSFREDREKVQVVAGGPAVPHARPYEGIGTRGDTFRHPVHGNREVWVEQDKRPFIFPAAEAHGEEVTGLIRAALDEAAASIGF
jgi:hypothetical protein